MRYLAVHSYTPTQTLPQQAGRWISVQKVMDGVQVQEITNNSS